jgi:PAS domain S-box-containing protein
VAIGEVYKGPLRPVLEKAFDGESIFTQQPWTDPRGTWVTAAAPMRNFRGDVDAVLVADFDARPLVAGTVAARRATLGGAAAVLIAIAAASALLAQRRVRAEVKPPMPAPAAPVVETKAAPVIEPPAAPVLEKPEPTAAPSAPLPVSDEASRIEKQKLETLVNSIDGIVWEYDVVASRFTFISRQCEQFLGYTPEQWMAAEDFWQSKLHPDDQWAAEQGDRMVAGKAPYSYDYRMIAADGRTVWIRENAAVLLTPEGAPLLVRGVFYDITARKNAAAELEQANAALVESSRFAGMAEVATGVLHNVGNVLNSVNVSGNVISERLRKSKVIELGKVAGLLTLQAGDFAGFVARDPRGPHIPELISCVAEALKAEHAELLEEVEAITRNIGHIKEIVAMQQGFAKGAGTGLVEPLTIQTLVDDAIKINSVSLARHRIAVVQAYEDVPQVLVDKHLILQILVNLLRNAKQAIQQADSETRRIVVKIQSHGTEFVRVAVQDTGSGIAPENLTRIFSHGFTTKKSGHGFGLHSSSLAATGMGGSLQAHSDGPGTGATFTLDLPIYHSAPVAVAA